MTAVQLNAMNTELWQSIGAIADSDSLMKRLTRYAKKLVKERKADPYEISPSGDTFFADSRNVKAVEDDIRKAHAPHAKFTRLESKEDIMSMINAL